MPLREARAAGSQLLRWYRRHRRDLPWRRTRDPYRIWVSEIMLQQTTVRAVVPYYRRFLRRFPSLPALAAAGFSRVLASWSGLGYYRRARHLHQAARTIMAAHGGKFPRTPREILALPGIGRYTAGAILSIAFGRREPVLDGNVARVLSRLMLQRGDPRVRSNETRLWEAARSLVEASSAPGDLNQALMELGATLCTPLAPGCPRCPLARRCLARAAGVEEKIPPPRRRRPTVTLRQKVALVQKGDRLLMRRREATGLMDGLWEFPALSAGRRPASDQLRLAPQARLATVRHSITYRRLLVEVHRARLLAEPRGNSYRWVDPRRLAELPISSLAAKILAAHNPTTVAANSSRRARVRLATRASPRFASLPPTAL